MNPVVVIVPHGKIGQAIFCIHVVVILSLEITVCIISNVNHITHPILLI